MTRGEPKRVNLWFGFIDNHDKDGRKYVFDCSDATVVHNSPNEHEDETELYKRRFNARRIGTVKEGLAICLLQTLGIDKTRRRALRFFLMQFLLQKVRSREKWGQHLLGRNDATIVDV